MIILTGASSGIGKEVAIAAAKQGHKMILISRRDPQIEDALWIKTDLTSKEQVISACDQIKGSTKSISMLIHCAGIMKSCSSSSIDIDFCLESYMVNAIAPLTITSQLTRLLAKGKASVVALSSIASMLDIPGEAIYSSTKAALDQGFNTLSADLNRLGITFIKIHPCMIDTPMTQDLSIEQKDYMHLQRSTKKQPTPQELAEYILQLESMPQYLSGSDIMFGGIKR